MVVLGYWHFRQTEHLVTRRAFSMGNVNDFSWRNRLSAWEGTWQMMADRPWFGFGWNQPEPVYEYYYLADETMEASDAAAIQMNDYLMLGATLGIPALFCFMAYLWLSLTHSGFGVPPLGGAPPKPRERGTPNLTADFLPVICRAGAIVLLVGFWFDGGLFKLPTAATFWILLELGRQDLKTEVNHEIHEAHEMKHECQ